MNEADCLDTLRSLKTQQQALRESEQKYRNLIQMARCRIIRFELLFHFVAGGQAR